MAKKTRNQRLIEAAKRRQMMQLPAASKRATVIPVSRVEQLPESLTDPAAWASGRVCRCETPIRFPSARQIYCSGACKVAAWRDRNRKPVTPPLPTRCAWKDCTNEQVSQTPGKRARKYCSDKCRQAASRDRRRAERS